MNNEQRKLSVASVRPGQAKTDALGFPLEVGKNAGPYRTERPEDGVVVDQWSAAVYEATGLAVSFRSAAAVGAFGFDRAYDRAKIVMDAMLEMTEREYASRQKQAADEGYAYVVAKRRIESVRRSKKTVWEPMFPRGAATLTEAVRLAVGAVKSKNEGAKD